MTLWKESSPCERGDGGVGWGLTADPIHSYVCVVLYLATAHTLTPVGLNISICFLNSLFSDLRRLLDPQQYVVFLVIYVHLM